MRRYEVQKQASILNAMVRLATRHSVSDTTKLNLTKNLQAHQWDDPKVKEFLNDKGFTPESLAAQGMINALEEIQKIDMLIALRVKTLGQLQQSYEALVNRSVMQERLKLQNDILRRDLQAIDVEAVEQADGAQGGARGKR